MGLAQCLYLYKIDWRADSLSLRLRFYHRSSSSNWIRSTLSRVGWNEGINTSAPLIYLINQGPLRVPTTKDSVLDIIPVDLVAIGMILSSAELLEGTHQIIYQYGTSDNNPLEMFRLMELVSLSKRRQIEKKRKNPLVDMFQQRMEAQPIQ